MPFAVLDRPYLLRQELLGTEAVYEVLGEDGDLLTAEVVSAPGLEAGTRVCLHARAARRMERSDPSRGPERPPAAATPRPARFGALSELRRRRHAAQL
jgi:hypothetical protein